MGAGIYSEVFPLIQDNLLKVGVYDKITFPGVLGVNHWAIIVPVVLVFGFMLYWVDKKGL